MIDLEASTFQRRPAYRYIRLTDKLPPLGATREEADPTACVKLFDPTGHGTWYVVEYDPATRVAFGLVDGFEREAGDFSMAELVDFRGQFGLPIERDLTWSPRPLSECA